MVCGRAGSCGKNRALAGEFPTDQCHARAALAAQERAVQRNDGGGAVLRLHGRSLNESGEARRVRTVWQVLHQSMV
jgi:hypothetical protein